MATEKQVKAAKQNVRKAQAGARSKRSIAHLQAKTRTAFKQGAAVVKRKRSGGSTPKTRQELHDEAKGRNRALEDGAGTSWPGRSASGKPSGVGDWFAPGRVSPRAPAQCSEGLGRSAGRLSGCRRRLVRPLGS